MKALFPLLLTLLCGHKSFAGPQYDGTITSALRFIERHQTTGVEGYDPGQWVVRVTSYLPSKVGVGKFGVPYDEPTAFFAASVANVLAEIYFLNPQFREIPPMIKKTIAGFTNYYWDHLFNFYPPTTYHGVPVRQPRYMYLAPRFQGFANIPPDADTTSVSYTTMHYLNKINQGPQAVTTIPEQVIEAFSKARDVNRKPHVWNAAQGIKNTGAFLTWLFDEDDPKMPRNIFAQPNNGTRIPFNRNDVDCVVNAHVVKLLTVAQKTDGPGYRASCEHLNNMALRKDFFFCGLYYPSRYILPYTMASDLALGASCLEPSREKILRFLLRKQHRDGSWRNSIAARPDRIQSTAWALSALALLGDPTNPLHRQRVRQGADFLLENSITDRDGLSYWPGEVFFAATFVARFPVVWRSTTYTTAVATKALVLAERFQR